MRSKIRGDLEQKLAADTAALEERLRIEDELRRRIGILEKEISRVGGQATPLKDLEASVRKLSEQFAAFQQSYICDIDKLVALLFEVQSALHQRKRASLTDRVRSLLIRQKRDKVEGIVEPMIPDLKRTV
jgi:uncharacterized small protein (DUF1192 family)